MTHAYKRLAAAGVSVWLDDLSRPRITSGDLAQIVATVTSSDDVERTKPTPDIFATALAKLLGIDAKEALVVGDTPYDTETAGKCGIAVIALRFGKFPDEVLRAARAVAIYDDVAALLAGYADSPLGR